MGYPIKKTQMNLTREPILQLYAPGPGAAEWGALVNRFDEQDRFVEDETPLSQAEAEDELAAWLDNIDLDDNHDHPHDHAAAHNHHTHGHGHGARRATASSSTDRGTRGYELYRCSWCGNPSAVLRKCGGCAKTRCVCVYESSVSVSVAGEGPDEMIAPDDVRRRTRAPNHHLDILYDYGMNNLQAARKTTTCTRSGRNSGTSFCAPSSPSPSL